MSKPKAKILVVFYSCDGSVEALAKAVSEEAREVPKSGSAACPKLSLRR
jgi:hypothetical protein